MPKPKKPSCRACAICGKPAPHVVVHRLGPAESFAVLGEAVPAIADKALVLRVALCGEHYKETESCDSALRFLCLSSSASYEGAGSSRQIAGALVTLRDWTEGMDKGEAASLIHNFWAAFAKRPGLFVGLANELAREYRDGQQVP